MTFQPQPSVRHSRARKVVDEAVAELSEIALEHTSNEHQAAAADVKATINAIVNCATVRLKDR